MRVLNRVLAAVLALALLVGGVVAVAEIVLAALRRPYWLVAHDQWTRWLATHTFATGIVRVILIGLVLVGLLLLVAGLRRGRPGSLTLPSDQEALNVTASRRGIERTLSAAARRPDGVSSARVRARRRTVRVKAATRLRDPGELSQRVDEAVVDRLTQLGLAGSVRARVSVSTEGSR